MSTGDLPSRVGWLERTQDRHEKKIEELDHEKADEKVVARLAEAVDSLRKAVLAFAFTVAASAIAVSLTFVLTHYG
jgi:4-alpha-glucanotransferase